MTGDAAAALAVAAPAAGVFLCARLYERPRAVRFVDVMVYLSVPGFVAWEVLPDAWGDRDLSGVALVVLGLVSVTLAERVSSAWAERADGVAILTGLSGIVLHALLEGAALSPGGAEQVSVPFVAAVAFHRVFVGLVIWWLLWPRHGVALAAAGVGAIMVATLAGYFAGTELGTAAGAGGIELYQAFVAGTLLHVVFHQGWRRNRAGPHGGDSAD